MTEAGRFAPTAKSFRITGNEFFGVVDGGRIEEVSGVSACLGMLQQLGLPGRKRP